MEMTATSHIPTEPYGFVEIEYSFIGGKEGDFLKRITDDYILTQHLFNKEKATIEEISGVKWKKVDGKNYWYNEEKGEWVNG